MHRAVKKGDAFSETQCTYIGLQVKTNMNVRLITQYSVTKEL